MVVCVEEWMFWILTSGLPGVVGLVGFALLVSRPFGAPSEQCVDCVYRSKRIYRKIVALLPQRPQR